MQELYIEDKMIEINRHSEGGTNEGSHDV